MQPQELPESGTISSTIWKQICEKRLEVMLVTILLYTTGLLEKAATQVGGVC